MSRGKRYNDEQKLNLKKVFAVVIAIIVIIMFFIGIKKLLNKKSSPDTNFTEIAYFTVHDGKNWGVVNSKGEYVINPEYSEMITIPNNKKDVFICMYDFNSADGSYKTKAVNSKNAEIFTAFDNIEVLTNFDSKGNMWIEENVLKVSKNGKYGIINLDGTEILNCDYESIDTLKGVNNSIVIKKDGALGLVNNRGDRIIETQYQEIQPLNVNYENGYIVKGSNNKYGIIAPSKEQILECKYDEIKHICGNDLYVVKENGKWKITNKAADKTLEVNYEDITYLTDEVFVIKSNGKFGIVAMDKSEKVKPEYQKLDYAFSDNYIAQKDNKFGVINSNGEILVQFEYDDLIFNKDADCLVGKKNDNENVFLIDRNLEVKVTGKNMTLHNGYIRINVNDEYKFYNLKFEEKNNREVFANNTLYVAKNEGKYGLVNKDGTLVVKYQYDDITEQNPYGYVAIKKDGKWGIIDQYGNIVVDTKYEFTDISKVTVIGKWHSVENIVPTYFVCE